MGSEHVVLVGKKFSRLLVLSESERPRSSRSARYWVCRCDCGVVKDVRGPELKNGNTKSCGCLNVETHTTHGKEGTKIYNVWGGMKYRAQTETAKAFSNYGGRGITVCDRWQSFENFYADMGEPPEGMQLERVDNDKGYSPENCKWAGRKDQAFNRRTTVRVTFKGKTMSLTDWAEETGVSRTTLGRRYKAGWSVEDMLTKPLTRRSSKK